jgi:hypothetical protein
VARKRDTYCARIVHLAHESGQEPSVVQRAEELLKNSPTVEHNRLEASLTNNCTMSEKVPVYKSERDSTIDIEAGRTQEAAVGGCCTKRARAAMLVVFVMLSFLLAVIGTGRIGLV